MLDLDHQETNFRTFDHMVELELLPFLKEEEAEFKHLKRLQDRLILAAAAVFILISILLIFAGLAPFILIIAIVGWAVLRNLPETLKGDFRRKIKRRIMRRVCAYLGLKYGGRSKVVRALHFWDLKIVPECRRWKAEDAISGRFNGQQVDLVELTQWVERGQQEKVNFQGILIVLPVTKAFCGKTLMLSKGSFKNPVRGWSVPGKQVRLEDPEFQEAFDVYSDDQVEARYLLTPLFMNRMLAIAREMGLVSVRAAFDQGKLYLALEADHNHFEWNMDQGKLADRRVIEPFVKDLCVVFQIVQMVTQLSREPDKLSEGALKL